MTSSLHIAETIPKLKQILIGWREQGRRIGFVPTMGALHAGHMSLIETAKQSCDRVVASIFVNPTQFGPNEDFSRYPRPIEADQALLEKHGADLLFLPTPKIIYPAGFTTKIEVGALSDVLCGPLRPGHFSGVATVVTILLNLIRPDQSFFGEKDYQQLLIIKRIARDLHLPGDIIGCPTVREKDGLALSSRNQYLSPEERNIAPKLYETMGWVKENAGQTPLSALLEKARNKLLTVGFTKIDYFEIRHQETLEPIETTEQHARLFTAVWLGRTRLIDNIALRA